MKFLLNSFQNQLTLTTFADEVSPEQFSESIDTDDNYVAEIHGYLGGLDSTFTEEIDIETFATKMREEGKEDKKKKEEKKEEEKVKTRLDIDTDIPKTREDVDAKYSKYLEALQMPNQTIAVDPMTGLPLTGDALVAEIDKVTSDRDRLYELVETSQDEIEFAEKLKDIQLKSLPTEQEIEYKMSLGFDPNYSAYSVYSGGVGAWSKDDIKGDFQEYSDGTESFETDYGNALNPILLDRMRTNIPDKYKDPEGYIKYKKEKGEEEERREEERVQAIEDTEEEMSKFTPGGELFNVGQATTYYQGGALGSLQEDLLIDLKNQPVDKTADIKDAYQQLVKGAQAAGFEVGSDKSRKDEEDYYYMPKLDISEGAYESEFILEGGFDALQDKGEGKNSVFYQANYVANRDALAQAKLNSKTLQKETNDLLEKFEDEKGVSGWNHAVNIIATIGGGAQKYIAEQALGMTLDEAVGIGETSAEGYKKNQKELADLLDLSQKGDERLISSTMWNIRNEATGLLAKEQQLNTLYRKLQNQEVISEEDRTKFNTLRDELIQTQKLINADVEYLGNLSYEGTNIGEIMNKVGKTYDELQVMENIFANSVVRFGTGLGSVVNELNAVNLLEWAGINLKNEDGSVNQEIIEEVYDFFGDDAGSVMEGVIGAVVAQDNTTDYAIKKAYDWGQSLIDKNRPPVQVDDIDSVADALSWTGEMLSGQVVNTAVSCIPYAGVWLTGAAEAGSKMLEMKTEMQGVKWNDEELAYINQQKEQFGKDYNPLGNDDVYKIKPREVNALEFYSSAVIYGASEVLLEKVKVGNLKIGIDNVKRASYNLGKMSKKGIVTTNKATTRMANLKNSGLDYIKGMPQESITEGLTQVAQNGVDKYILDKDVSLLDGVTESMLSGAVMASTLQSPGLIAQTYSAFRGSDRNITVAKRGADILNINESLNKKYAQLAGLDPSSKEHKQIVESAKIERAELANLIKEQLKDQNDVKAEIMSFNKSDRQGLIDIFNKEHDIRSKIDAINDNTSISKEVADKAINEHLNELAVLDTLKNFTIKNGKWNADKAMGRKLSNAYRAKKGLKGSVKMIAANNNKQALDFGLNYIETKKDLTPQEKNALKEDLKKQFDDADKASSGDQTVNGFAWGDGIKIETTDANNVTTEKTIDIPMTFALSRNNSTVMSHEVGHHTLFSEFVANNKDAVGLVDDLEAYVKRNYKEAYEIFKEVKEIYGTYNQKGELQNRELVAEEKLARLSDFMRQNDLQGDRTLYNKLFGRFQNINDGSGQIQSGKDVFDMLASYNESYETGKLVGLTKSIAEGTADVSRKKKSLKESTKPKPRKMGKKSITKAEKDQVEDRLNELPGPKGPDGNYLMTKDQWQADKDRALSNAITIAMDGDLDGLIIEKMESGQTIHDLSREEFMSRVYTKLGMHVYNFNPSVSRSLFGWINTYIGARVGDVANQAKRQKAPTPTIKLDKKISDEGSRTVAETIKGDDADSIIDAIDAKDAASRQEAIIDNLRTRLGIEKGGPLYNKVLAAVEKTFGRTKLKDVSNTKFKQDLKNKFNTELFKTVKNSLGTRAAYKDFIEGDVIFKDSDGNEVKIPRIKMLFDYFSQEVFNKRFEQFKEKLIDPSTGKQARPENNPLFRKRDNITKKELIDYFLGSDVGASTKGTRKDALASAIAQELAFDATMEVLEDADIQNNIKEFYELQGLRQAENFTEKVGKIIDRKPGAKFSVTKDGGVRDNTSILNNASDFFNSKESEITSGKDVINIIDNYYNSLDREAQAVIEPYLSGMKKAANEVIKGELTIDKLRQAAIIRSKTGTKGFELESFSSWNRGKDSYVSKKFPKRKDQDGNEVADVTLPSKEKGGAYSIKGEQRLKDFVNDFSNTLDPTIADLPFFRNTITASGNLKLQSAIDAQNAAIKKAGGTGINDVNFNKANNTYTNPKTNKVTKIPARSLTQDVAKKDWINVNKDNASDFKQKYPNIDPSLAKPITESEYKYIENKIIKRFSETKDLTDPNVQLELTNEINKYLDPGKKGRLQAVEAVRDYFYSKLNDYVNQYPKGSKKYFQAIGDVIALLQEQTNSATGIARGGAYLKSLTLDFKQEGKPYQREHNLQLLNFNANVLNSIIENTFDTKYESLVSQYSQSLLDTDAQKVLDGKMTTKEFLEKYEDFNPELLNALQGKTGLLPGYLSGMQSESIFALALGNASRTLMLEYGTTLDNVIYNQLAGQKGLNYLNSFVKQAKSKLSKSPMGKTILNTENKSAIFESKENKDLFNEVLSEVANDQNIDNTSIELGIKLENKENYNNRDEANNKMMKDSGVVRKFSISKNTNKEVIDQATVMDKALNIARDPNAPVKKIRVFDFDDTLATTESDVLYTAPDGTKGKLNAEEFAKDGSRLLEEGYVFDFSEFNKVTKGKPGPLLDIAKKIQAARGTGDVFVLTARAPEAQIAIKEFLDSQGLNIPLENITGLGNSTGAAKANWIVNKAAEGYNDFYFADDATQNVQAVKDALSVIDVKSSVQQAKIKFSKTVDKTVNDMLEHKFGIKSEAEYSDVKARLVGRKKGKFKLFIPPSAEDFVGLLYAMLGKGEIGNMQMDFFREHLIEPYGRAMENLSRDQNRMINDFKVLKAQLVKEGLIPKNLNKKAFGKFTIQDVSRILAWHKQGMNIPGISKSDLKQVLKYAKDNPAVDVFAQSLIDINKGDGYAAPNENWLAGTISTDLLDGLRTGKRGKYLQQWKDNVDLIFSPKNLNKMEAALGSNWREAMEDMLRRMESGQNRSSTAGRLENRLLDYINNSVGTVMFFNMRSALLQTISSINFIDFGSNNIFKAAAAFANQKQYWKDFMELMNSEFLVERRNGLKLNVSESEIADAAATSKNKAKAAIAYILTKGYLPTQFADSFAIASGGATFYRNRIKALMKEGMSEADAKKQAFLEFREIAEESQQSSRPDRVSQQQASTLGRLILAFQNTPMQMNRLGKKSFLDLKNRRKRPGMTQLQSDMSNISRVGYYMAVQSLIFSSLQQALFAIAFDDEEPEDEKERYYNVANGVINTILNGTGIIGVSVSTLISVARKVYKESAKEGTFPGPAYEDAANEMLNFSPPIDIKLSKLRQAGLTWKYEGYKHDEAKWGIDDPAYKSAAYAISGLTNIPLDRLLHKAENVRSAVQDDWETWQRVSLLLGWSKYQLQNKQDRAEEREAEKAKKAAFRKRIKESKTRKYYPKKPLTVQEQVEKNEKEKEQKEFDKYKKLKKPRQVEMLDSLGLTKKEIRSLRYEKDRVAKLIELMNK